jgi:sigma-54 dependent transcriptional regulator
VYAGKLKMHDPQLSDDAETALLAYAWPGNIRELENVVHYALIVCRDGLVRASDFRFSPLARAAAPRPTDAPAIEAVAQTSVEPSAPPHPTVALERALDGVLASAGAGIFDTVEALLVRRAFSRCRDNQVQTARLLGITRNTLRTLLKRHGMLGEAAEAVEQLANA